MKGIIAPPADPPPGSRRSPGSADPRRALSPRSWFLSPFRVPRLCQPCRECPHGWHSRGTRKSSKLTRAACLGPEVGDVAAGGVVDAVREADHVELHVLRVLARHDQAARLGVRGPEGPDAVNRILGR